ncbi:MAG: hypothetical protein II393_03350 [Cytophagales bacterium]|nr:hypothetical protein [Cytophagales bacterium]
MSSTTTLFSITIQSEYYSDGVSRDFTINPSSHSQQLFKRYNLQVIFSDGTYKLVWLTKNIKNISQCQTTIFKDLVFTFDIKVQNINVYKFSQLQTNKTYNFTNNDNNNLLHKNSEISDEDLSNSTEYADKLLGIIKINMNNVTLSSKEYIIKIPTIKSFWQIKFHGNTNKIKSINKFFLDGKKYNFTNMNEGNNKVFISSSQIQLKNVGLQNLSISLSDDDRILLSSPIYYDRITHDGKYLSEIDCCL